MLGGDARSYRHFDRVRLRRIQSGSESDSLSANELLSARQRLKGMEIDTTAMSDDDIQQIALDRARSFREEAPTSAATAAKIILDVKAERWRILVGDDADRLDQRVRQAPERAYDAEFYQGFVRRSAGDRLRRSPS